MNQRAGLTTTPAPGDGAGLRLEINQQEIVGGWATGNGVIAWPESGKINRMHGDSRGQVKGVFGDCQFTCFPDCQLALSPDPAMNPFFPVPITLITLLSRQLSALAPAQKVIIFILATLGILTIKLFFANTVIPLPFAASPSPQNREIKDNKINT